MENVSVALEVPLSAFSTLHLCYGFIDIMHDVHGVCSGKKFSLQICKNFDCRKCLAT